VGSVTLLIGGARSGKSDLAVEIGRRHDGAVTFVATAQHFDADMTDRITRHRAERPPWPTVEAPVDLARALAAVPADDLLIVDCLTLWVSNSLLAEHADHQVEAAATEHAALAAGRRGPTVVVTNEVGLGIHPDTDLGRRYRDLLGRVNRCWAAAADRTLFLVAGRALPLLDPWELLT
jgi:adenosyl cobinamide kinase/adenosyl cobinamide phosphate guanylyltransferase